MQQYEFKKVTQNPKGKKILLKYCRCMNQTCEVTKISGEEEKRREEKRREEKRREEKRREEKRREEKRREREEKRKKRKEE
ncbi:hypothetical protein DUI87_16336 [Hirundo rustica rustica]|uniref:Uncharacterized protein n=1 Tax=Hirundo rustica rustica TaxID=333673 RepID=A0A3M0K172_HIRRU|nr:hypothetical protein DUI87_16336 [Hirundo rustica rustica]